MIKKLTINCLLTFALTLFLGLTKVSANTYSPTDNLFENSYTNNLIDMAVTQIPNFLTKDYVIFVSDNSYYLVSGIYDDNSNPIHFTDTTIIRAYRYNNYNYTYETFTESSTYVYRNNILTGNINGNNIVSSSRFNNYLSNHHLKIIGVFILGLVFAIFVTKERRY